MNVAWEATGAARDMDICLKFIQPNGNYGGGRVVSHDASYYANVAIDSAGTAVGEWTVRVSALFEGDSCSATVDNFCSECDNPRSERNFILEAPRVNYCNVTSEELSYTAFSEGPVRGDAACQVAVNQWVVDRGAGGFDRFSAAEGEYFYGLWRICSVSEHLRLIQDEDMCQAR